MALMTWSEQLSVGVGSFDAQHRRLIALINELHDAMGAGKGSEAVGGILDQLAAYTLSHFSGEEAVMQQHDYPGLRAHRAEHEKFVAQVKALQADRAAGKPFVSLKTTEFLKSWITTHINGTDMKYGPYLNGKGVR